MKEILNYFRRSIIGRLTALTLVILVFGFTYLSFLPYWEFREQSEPIDYTRGEVSTQLFQLERDTFKSISDTPDEFEHSPFDPEILAEVKRLNPEFKWHLRIEKASSVFLYGDEPRWFDQFRHSRISVPQEQQSESDECVRSTQFLSVSEEIGVGRIRFTTCGDEVVYREYSGLKNSLPSSKLTLFDLPYMSMWNSYRDFLIIGGAIFVAALGLIYATRRSLNRVANITHNVSHESLHLELPEEGVPTEVLPLIHAVNDMIGEVEGAQNKQKFFLSAAAHEMRTPLTILYSRLELLPDDEYKYKLKNDVRRITKLVNQLLKLMRIKDQEVKKNPVDLVELCRDVIKQFRRLCREKDVTVSFYSQCDTSIIEADRGMLEVAISNLIDNAISFSAPGQMVVVEVGDLYQINVTDSGPGVSEEKLGTVFEPFAKSPPNRDGHGLGLAIVKSIVELHRGEVSVRNKPNEGACFTLQFPAA